MHRKTTFKVSVGAHIVYRSVDASQSEKMCWSNCN